ncbi:hypothetical protein BH18ACT4_BH18ACT4_11250 [soil metagenome]
MTERFAFVHLHKSGGSFVSAFLVCFFPSAVRIGYHYPVAHLPVAYQGLPVLGSVRNPWDVYVSYYFFQLALLENARARNAAMSAEELEAWIAAGNDPLNGIDVVFEELSEGGSLDFATTTRRLLDLGVDDALLDRVLELMPTTLDRRGRSTPPQTRDFRGMNVRADDLATIRGTGEGFYSFLFRHLFGDGTAGDADGAHFLRTESLRDDLLDYLSLRGVAVTPEMESFVRRSERVNTSQHKPSTSYYDPQLGGLVRERDGGLVKHFGYHFDHGVPTP